MAAIEGHRSKTGQTTNPVGDLYKTYVIAGGISWGIGTGAKALGGQYGGWYNPFEWAANIFRGN